MTIHWSVCPFFPLLAGLCKYYCLDHCENKATAAAVISHLRISNNRELKAI